jgi:uncharacterized membrane protein YhaH (DUF805 family)
MPLMAWEPADMTGLIHHLRLLFDPRGRTNRQNLLVTAIVIVIIESFLMMGPLPSTEAWVSPASAIKGIVIWICCVSIIKRLHDLDLSGWWLVGGLGFACMWTAVVAIISLVTVGASVFQQGHPGSVIILSLVMLPVLGATLWLHLAPGTTVANRFGGPERAQNAAPKPVQTVSTT